MAGVEYAVETEIRRLEQKEAEARRRLDVDVLESLWSDSLIVNNTANLVMTKSQMLALARAGLLHLGSFERISTRMEISPSLAVSTGNETIVPSTGADIGKSIFCSYMNVWVEESTGWKLVARHVGVISRVTTG